MVAKLVVNSCSSHMTQIKKKSAELLLLLLLILIIKNQITNREKKIKKFFEKKQKKEYFFRLHCFAYYPHLFMKLNILKHTVLVKIEKYYIINNICS